MLKDVPIGTVFYDGKQVIDTEGVTTCEDINAVRVGFLYPSDSPKK